jgi:hypothetical protein
MFAPGHRPAYGFVQPFGRFPANLILGGEEVVEGFPSPHGAGSVTDGKHCAGKREGYRKDVGAFQYGGAAPRFGDSGSASRFFFNFSEQESDE